MAEAGTVIPDRDDDRRTGRPDAAGRVARRGLLAALALMGLAMALPAVTGWNVHVRSFPPLHAAWDPRIGWGTVPAVVLAYLGARFATHRGLALGWGRLLVEAYLGGLLWMLSLAFVDGTAGIGHILNTDYEYLNTARATTDLPATLAIYVDRIPFDAPLGNWPVHIAGHPPGALTFFVALVRIGLGSGFAAGMVVTVIAASTALAVMITLRTLGAERQARLAAPFLVLGPAAIWQSVSADAMFAAVAAWGLAALARAATRQETRSMLGWSALAGLLLGYCVMLSYGLPLLGILALAVLLVARNWRPLVPTAIAAAAVVLVYAAYGFRWWEALPVLRERYWAGVAHVRPAAYWMWGNLAALCFSAGPVLGAGLATAARRWGERLSDTGSRAALWLAGAGVATVLAADASQMSRAEVERIWLPFVPWLLVATAFLPARWRSPALVVQLVSALLVQHLLATGW